MTIHRSYSKGDPHKVAALGHRDRAMAFADPGADGVVLFWADGFSRWPCPPDLRRSIGSNAAGHRQVALACEEMGVETFVVEDQYLGRGKGARTMITLIRSAGQLAGHVQMRARPEEIIWIPPWAWQKRLPKHKDSKKRSTRHALSLLGPEWLEQQGRSSLRQACADVVGIAAFYEEITRHEQVKLASDVGF
jgi:hypothetical protein